MPTGRHSKTKKGGVGFLETIGWSSPSQPTYSNSTSSLNSTSSPSSSGYLSSTGSPSSSGSMMDSIGSTFRGLGDKFRNSTPSYGQSSPSSYGQSSPSSYGQSSPSSYGQSNSSSYGQSNPSSYGQSRSNSNLSSTYNRGGKNKGRKSSRKIRGGYSDNINLTGVAADAAPVSVGGKRRTKKNRRHRHVKSCKRCRR